MHVVYCSSARHIGQVVHLARRYSRFNHKILLPPFYNDLFNDNLRLEIAAYNRSRSSAPRRSFTREKQQTVRLTPTRIPIKFNKISFDEVVEIIVSTNGITQSSPDVP